MLIYSYRIPSDNIMLRGSDDMTYYRQTTLTAFDGSNTEFGRPSGIPSKKRPRPGDRRNQEINSILAFFD